MYEPNEIRITVKENSLNDDDIQAITDQSKIIPSKVLLIVKAAHAAYCLCKNQSAAQA